MSINIKTIFGKIGHSDRVPLVKERYLMTKLFNSASCCKIIASCKTLIGLQFTVDYSFNLSRSVCFWFSNSFFDSKSFSFDEFHKISYLSKTTTAWKLIPKVIRIYLDLNLLWHTSLHQGILKNRLYSFLIFIGKLKVKVKSNKQ